MARTLVEELLRELPGTVSESQEVAPEEAQGYAVDGLVPRAVAAPATVEEMAAVLALADRTGCAVVPRGAGTKLGLGGIPRAYDLAVSTARLDRVLEYEPADLTVTVQAGIPLARLQETLAQGRQFLPLDPPHAARATVGGIIAANASGPSRLLYGSARDLVIGTRVVHADGVVSKAGGKVVKNVAGYDLNKLYIGSLGTLGVVVELTFKVQPLPEAERSLAASFASTAEAAACVARVLRSPLFFRAVELLDPRAAGLVGTPVEVPEGGCALLAWAAGFEKAVARQVRDLEAMAREGGALDVRPVDGPSHDELWQRVRDVRALVAGERSPVDENGQGRTRPRRTRSKTTPSTASAASVVVAKVSVPLSQVAPLFQAARSAGDPLVMAHAGSGVLYLHLPLHDGAPEALADAARVVEQVRREAVQRGGSLVVEEAPPELKRLVDVWGDVGDAFPIMRGLKEKLDPKGTLNPGRFVGGL